MMVMMPVCSAGSNHVGATETWTAQVIWLGPWAAVGAGARTPASRTRARTRTNNGHRVFKVSSLRVPRTASTSGVRENPAGSKDAQRYRESPGPVKQRLIGPWERAYGTGEAWTLRLLSLSAATRRVAA